MMTHKVWGKSSKITICLEDISSIETHYKSNILFLIIGVILALVGLVTGLSFIRAVYSSIVMSAPVGLGGLVLGGIFIAIWWFTRKHLVTISSNGGSHLNFIVEKMSDEKIDNFVTSVLEAKIKRVNQLFML
jgi:hypothetical protein